MYLLTTVLSLSLMCLATFAYPNAFHREQANRVELKDELWQNDWDKPLLLDCDPPEGIYRVRSKHSNYYEDRRWRWFCDDVSNGAAADECQWHNDINTMDGDMDFECPPNQYIAGVSSTHSNYYEDRIWDVKCCEKSNVCLTDGVWTAYINLYDKEMDYTAYYFAGLNSVHSNHYEDRIWKVLVRALDEC